MKQDWETKKLSEVFSLEYGKPLPKDKRTPDGLYPVYGANGIKDRTNEFYVDEPSIIVGRKGSAGEINYTEPKFWPLDVTYYAKFNKKELNIDFLYHLLNLLELPKLAKGVKPGINRNDVYAITAKIPLLPEQERIVAKLDQCFEAIDKAIANVKCNLQNAKELFQSQLNKIFSRKGDGWMEKKLGEVYDVRDGTHDSPKYQEKGFPLVTSKNLKNNSVTFEKIKYISNHDYVNINKRSKVDIGDVLFAMIGTIGNPVVITLEPNFAIKNVALFKVPKEHSSQFLYYYLESKNVVDRMAKDAKGSTQRFVGLGYLRSFSISIPPLILQQKLVMQLDVLNKQTQSLEIYYQQKIGALDELKKSILQKAFNGELTTIPKEATV